MVCRICGEEINEKGQDNVSVISGFPICEDCQKDIECNNCFAPIIYGELYYVEELDEILCAECIVKYAEEKGYIHSRTIYYTNEYIEVGYDDQIEGVLKYLKENEYIEIKDVKGE